MNSGRRLSVTCNVDTNLVSFSKKFRTSLQFAESLQGHLLYRRDAWRLTLYHSLKIC